MKGEQIYALMASESLGMSRRIVPCPHQRICDPFMCSSAARSLRSYQTMEFGVLRTQYWQYLIGHGDHRYIQHRVAMIYCTPPHCRNASTCGLRPTFQYKPLQHSTDLRLPSFGEKQKDGTSSAITCELARYSVDDAPRYNTLFYTWSTSGGQEETECPSGTALRITANLASWIRSHGISLAKKG